MNKSVNTKIIIDLKKLTPAEKKMYILGGFLAVYKYAPESFKKAGSVIHYYKCISEPVSENEVYVPTGFAANKSIEFDTLGKTFLTTFARLDYDMLCAVMERCKELGWNMPK